MTVEIKRIDFVSNQTPGRKKISFVKFQVWDPQTDLIHGLFDSDDFLGDVAAAEAAAIVCQAKFSSAPWRSPFELHRKILLSSYGGARVLRDLTLSLYNGSKFQWEAGRVSGLDKVHLEIAIDLIRSYNRHGESDKVFHKLCEEILDRLSASDER